jgi:hypothetical protein
VVCSSPATGFSRSPWKSSPWKKGKDVKEGDELSLEAWQPSTRFPPLPGPQGHQPVPNKGDLVKTYLFYDKNTKTYHPFMPNGIKILKKARDSK